MAGRLYVCPVIGTGVDEDPQRPLVADLGVTAWSACIATIDAPGASRGKPALAWSIVWADATSWSQVDGNNQCFQLTADLLDGPVSNRVRNALVQRNVATTQEIAACPTLRVLCDRLVQKHYGHATLATAFPQFGG